MNNMTVKNPLTYCQHPVTALVSGLLLGALLILGIRFATYKSDGTHYHANFAVYLNGTREEFKNPRYYQEEAICSKGQGITSPEARAHLHDADNSVIHVHDHAVTWGQLFNNIGWSIGTDFVQTDNGTIYREDATNKLHIYFNNQDYTGLTSIANRVIKDKDRLLVSYGNLDDATLMQEAKAVLSTAAAEDASKDPAACASNKAVSFSDRLHHLF